MTGAAPSVTYTVSVRELCAFARHGDLDLRFTPAPTALDGMRGHATVAARRGAGYERERALETCVDWLRVRGRADGVWPDRPEIEEIKTHRGAVERIPEHHRAQHWMQLKCYGALWCREHGCAQVRLSLVYFDLNRERETRISELHDAADLDAFFEALAHRFLDWAQQQRAHVQRRDALLDSLTFPYAHLHAGQRELAEAVYRGLRDGAHVLAQAPTGIGKTLGTLFPALKACARGHVDRVLCLTAKTSARRLVLDAADQLHAPQDASGARPLRVLELVARDKACEHPDKQCHGQSCPLARGFFDRLPAARAAAQQLARQDHESLRRLALAHDICPYYLAQELARWADVVVGDVNYYFDTSALLHVLAEANGWRPALLVDEAHNLLERARGMYSAELDAHAFALARRGAPRTLRRALGGIARAWEGIDAAQTQPYQVHDQPAPLLLDALAQFVAKATEWLGDHPEGFSPALQGFYFDALRWRALAESFGPHSLFDVTRTRGGTRLCLRNVVPAPFLAARLRAARAAVLYSATLQPFGFHEAMLGLPETTRRLDVPSPFDAAQLDVRVLPHLSTRYADREASLDALAAAMAAQLRRAPGNYLAFFSSFDYLERAHAAFRAHDPHTPTWCQTRAMPEAERQQFLDRFVAGGQGLGFAVLGGAFSEGVDLPGTRLIGAFIATLGLPQVNAVNEEFRRRLDALFAGRGYDYTYLYPGLQKVVQATGRVIRGPADRGSVLLLDDRYARAQVRGLLPRWWRIRTQHA